MSAVTNDQNCMLRRPLLGYLFPSIFHPLQYRATLNDDWKNNMCYITATEYNTSKSMNYSAL